jgi:protein TonB
MMEITARHWLIAILVAGLAHAALALALVHQSAPLSVGAPGISVELGDGGGSLGNATSVSPAGSDALQPVASPSGVTGAAEGAASAEAKDQATPAQPLQSDPIEQVDPDPEATLLAKALPAPKQEPPLETRPKSQSQRQSQPQSQPRLQPQLQPRPTARAEPKRQAPTAPARAEPDRPPQQPRPQARASETPSQAAARSRARTDAQPPPPTDIEAGADRGRTRGSTAIADDDRDANLGSNQGATQGANQSANQSVGAGRGGSGEGDAGGGDAGGRGSGSGASDNEASASNYYGRLATWLARHKRYPIQARRLRQEGLVKVTFTITSDGRVVSKRIAQSSGHELLDREVQAMLDRASPLPRIPTSLGRTSITITLPVAFNLR